MRLVFFITALVVSTAMLSVGSGKNKLLLSLDKETYLTTEFVNLSAQDLQPNTLYKVETSTEDSKGLVWTSFAEFMSDQSGKIDFSGSPQNGTYKIANSQGLFWSRSPENSHHDKDYFSGGDSFLTTVKLSLNGTQVDAVEFSTLAWSSEITVTESCKPDAFFDLVKPTNPVLQKETGVILLGGSEGGLSTNGAKEIASRGYTVLNLAYFGEVGLPKELIDVPVDSLIENIRDFKMNHPQLKKIIIWGGSKGAELGLLLGSLMPNEVNGVIAVVPSHVVWQGLSMTDFTPKSSWKFNDASIGFAPMLYEQSDFASAKILLRKGYERSILQIPDLSFAEIPVEKITGPILLISGTDDQVWPSDLMAEKIESRLKRMNFKYNLVNLIYQDAGHWIDVRPSLPKRNRYFNEVFFVGGNLEADGAAVTDATQKVFGFLDGIESH